MRKKSLKMFRLHVLPTCWKNRASFLSAQVFWPIQYSHLSFMLPTTLFFTLVYSWAFSTIHTLHSFYPLPYSLLWFTLEHSLLFTPFIHSTHYLILHSCFLLNILYYSHLSFMLPTTLFFTLVYSWALSTTVSAKKLARPRKLIAKLHTSVSLLFIVIFSWYFVRIFLVHRGSGVNTQKVFSTLSLAASELTRNFVIFVFSDNPA
jgi:hypothetical protein